MASGDQRQARGAADPAGTPATAAPRRTEAAGPETNGRRSPRDAAYPDTLQLWESRGSWPDPDRADDRALRDFLALVWRRRALIAATVAVATLVAAIVVFQLTPRYTAQTEILIGAPEANVVDIEGVLGGLGRDARAVRSEMRILTSNALAAKVVEALDLTAKPEFNPYLRPPTLLALVHPASWLPASWAETLFGADPELSAEDLEKYAKLASQAVVQSSIEVGVVDRSHVISVTTSSEDPAVAADLANTLAEIYLVDQLEAKYEATKRATDWLSERTRELREQVEAAERAVEAYRQEHDLIQSRDTTVTEQQISEINTQLILAKTQTAEADARLAQIRALVRADSGVDSAAEVLASPMIRGLRERETDVARRTAEMAAEYGPRHPAMINVRADLEDIRARIETEVQKVVLGLSNELEVARARERTLQGNLDQLEAENAASNSAQARLRVLEREAAANRALFDTFLARWKETDQQDQIQHPDARIISKAQVPTGPSFPRRTLTIAIAAALSAFAALMLVLVVEQLDRGFRSSDQIEQITGFGTLSLVPLLTKRQTSGHPHDYVLHRPVSAFAESLRTLHTGVLLADVDAPAKTVLIASSQPGEGKTTIAIAMARLLARGGHNVLLIDGDLRRKRIADLMGLSEEVGLVEVAAESGELSEGSIQQDRETSLDVLVAGTNVPSPQDLIGSARMTALLKELRSQYDLIVIDSPPLLAVSDARLLAQLADKVVFVVRWAETRREVAAMALRQLAESGASVAGVALSMVNVKKHAGYGYSDSGYYYGYGYGRKYLSYYGN